MFLRGLPVMLSTLMLFAACDDGVVAQPCSNIPEGGCPLARGVSCSDPKCEAVYACRPNNVWVLQERCPERDAPSPTSSDAAVDARPSVELDASIDAPPGAFGGPGCPPLQSPDCALGLALACTTGCCECEDLYVCGGGAWSFWGICGDAGVEQR